MYRRTFMKVVFSVAAGAMVSLSATSAFAQGLLEKARTQGITIGVGNDIPYGYITANGGAAGISPDVAKKVLNGMGITNITWKGMSFGQLIPAVKAGRIDLAATSQNVLPARCKQVAFSRVNSSYGEGLLVVSGNPDKIHSYADIKKNSKFKLGIVTGADELHFAQAIGIPQSQIVLVHSNADSIPALLSHRIDAFAATGLSVYEIAKKAPSRVERAEPFIQPIYHGEPTRSYGAFSMRRSDKAFLKAYNAELAKVQMTPFWAKTLEHYGLSKEDVAAARMVKTANLCKAK